MQVINKMGLFVVAGVTGAGDGGLKASLYGKRSPRLVVISVKIKEIFQLKWSLNAIVMGVFGHFI